ncbi:uncharacterized protein [Periplaneta americana]|uniref:uncharacterized protein n=1 Tax=Periplaneta americana TaxID=6978 RepID=UPI0037E81F1D
MAVFIFVLLFTSTLVSRFLCSEQQNAQNYELEFSASKFSIGKTITLKKGDTLNLTCKVTSANNISIPRFKLTIQTPYNPQNSMNRIHQNESYNSLNIVVQNLQESDSGDYKCQAKNDDEEQTQLQQVVLVVVKNKKPCGPQSYQCLTGICIMKRYLCDGYRDCKGGEDESEEECGPNPCESKLHCEDHRCIPIDWCCNSYHDVNCTVRVLPQCCNQLSKPFMDHDAAYINEQQPQGINDMGFLQTTIYTVVGCAMAFMFIATILVIAICRVHMKRSSLLTRCPGARGGIMMAPHSGNRAHHHHHHGLQHVPLYDLDVLLNRSHYPPTSPVPPHSGLMVTYNINNGVQFVGRPIDPPPYCEIVASPPREGPPPPYASHENLPRSNLEANSTAQDDVDVDDNPCERDSLLGAGRSAENVENIRLRGEYLETLAPALLNAGTVLLSSQQPRDETERNCQVGSDVHDHNLVSSSDTICSFGNDDRMGELLVESGLNVSSCENVVVAPKVPETCDITLSNVGVTGKSSANTSHVHHLDSSTGTNKISQDESSFNMVCDNQENPLQCLHDTFVAGDMTPGVDAAAAVRAKATDTAATSVTARTQTESVED